MKVKFTGKFFEYFIATLGLMLLTAVTLGLALPYMTYWQQKYFFEHLEIEGKAK
jgi:uncharacterized membrane protein YjgN (DUF898 family)